MLFKCSSRQTEVDRRVGCLEIAWRRGGGRLGHDDPPEDGRPQKCGTGGLEAIVAKRPGRGEGTQIEESKMSPSATTQQTNVTTVTQLDSLGDPSADALALATVRPFGGAVFAHVAIDQR